jgi:ubiquinone/menaquinone biosynthesis C-methylase UbiE
MSETALARLYLQRYCVGLGIDIGFGGDPVVPHALTFDQPVPYTSVGTAPQLLRGDCRDLRFLCNGVFDFVYSSHLIEDFTWGEIPPIIREWRRVLKPGGMWVTLCPDEPIYSAHCRATGQPYNHAHKNEDFSLETFKANVLPATGPWEVIAENPLLHTYSWFLVCRKI